MNQFDDNSFFHPILSNRILSNLILAFSVLTILILQKLKQRADNEENDSALEIRVEDLV